MTLVDLSIEFRSGITNPRSGRELDVQIRTLREVGEHQSHNLQYQFTSHSGTHIDAPRHLIVDGAPIGDIPLDVFYGAAVVLDVRRDADMPITVGDLEDVVPEIRSGDIVLLETGWSPLIGTSDYFDHHPFINTDAAQWLVEREIRMIGIDASSVDVPLGMREPGFDHPALRKFLIAGIPAVHSLVHLDVVRSRRCTVAAFPIVFHDADAGPVRVVAFID